MKLTPFSKTNLILTIVSAALLLSSCGSGSRNYSDIDTSVADSSTIITDIDTTSKVPAREENWTYSETEDKMTSKKTYLATVVANNMLEFDFPYDGGSQAGLTIRKKRGETNIYLQVSKGQFNSGIEGGNVRVRFDKSPTKTYSFSSASSGNSDVIFIDNEKSFLANLRKSKTVIIEAEFYSPGNEQIEFNTSGLVWNH